MDAAAMSVLLCHMPFASPSLPSLGIELLAATIRRSGTAADTFYGTLRFPRTPRIEALIHSVAGEAIFTPLVFARRSPAAVLTELVNCRRAVSELSSNYHRFFADPTGATSAEARDTPQDAAMVREELETHLALAADWANRCLDEIPIGRYAVYGFSVSFDAQRMASLAVAQRLKEREPDCRILFGGTAADGEMGEELLSAFPCIDAVCQGDADDRIVSLVDALAGRGALDGIPGVLHRSEGEIVKTAEARPPERLDELPFPDYDSFVAQLQRSEWREEPPILLFEASRGCWWGEKHHCRFCGLRADGMRYRRKSPQRVSEEVNFLAERYPQSRTLYATDAILDHQAARALLPALSQHRSRHPRKLFFEMKANATWRQISLMARASVTTVQPGIESFSDRVLSLMDKGNNAIANVELLRSLAAARIAAIYSLVAGTPGELASDYDEVFALLPRLHHLPPPQQVTFLQLDRFSPYFDDAARYRIHSVEPEPVYRIIYPDPSIDLRRLAYRFKFASPEQEDRPLRKAWTRLVHAVAEWRSDHERRGLWWRDEGQRLTVIEECRGERTAHALSGSARQLFRLLSRRHSAQALCDKMPGVAPSALLACLERWSRRGWIFRFRAGSYLGLAVELDPLFDDAIDEAPTFATQWHPTIVPVAHLLGPAPGGRQTA
jgi:ribosomal peptide maturation radical SAM protein 1